MLIEVSIVLFPQLLGEYDSLVKEHEGLKVMDLLLELICYILFWLFDYHWNMLDGYNSDKQNQPVLIQARAVFNHFCVYRTTWCQQRTSLSTPTIRYQNWRGEWIGWINLIISVFCPVYQFWFFPTLISKESWKNTIILFYALLRKLREVCSVKSLKYFNVSGIQWLHNSEKSGSIRGHKKQLLALVSILCPFFFAHSLKVEDTLIRFLAEV